MPRKVMVRAVMILYDGAKTRVRVGFAYSEEFEIDVHQGSVLSPVLFAIVVVAITENAGRGVVNKLMHWKVEFLRSTPAKQK